MVVSGRNYLHKSLFMEVYKMKILTIEPTPSPNTMKVIIDTGTSFW